MSNKSIVQENLNKNFKVFFLNIAHDSFILKGGIMYLFYFTLRKNPILCNKMSYINAVNKIDILFQLEK